MTDTMSEETNSNFRCYADDVIELRRNRFVQTHSKSEEINRG